MKRAGLAAVFLACSVGAGPLPAATNTAAAVRAAAEQAVQAQYGQAGSRVVIVPAPLNTRLRLAACPRALQTSLPPGQNVTSQVAVAVNCPGNGGWSIRVPVRIQLFRQVLVTTRPLARGDYVGPGDVHSEERDVARLGYGYVESLDQIAGRSLARPLNAGSVLDPGELVSREMVRAGDQVQLIAQLDGIVVRTTGLALDGGDTGARLHVRNGNSGRVVDAIVLGAGQVEALP